MADLLRTPMSEFIMNVASSRAPIGEDEPNGRAGGVSHERRNGGRRVDAVGSNDLVHLLKRIHDDDKRDPSHRGYHSEIEELLRCEDA
jgi:hypothetical protein